jgi:hypothetical protein
MDALFTLIKSLEPSSQVAVGFLAVLAFSASKLFAGRTPLRVKLVVFFSLVGFAGGALMLSGRNALSQAEKVAPPSPAQTAAPTPRAVPTSALERGLGALHPMAVAYADSSEGWLYLGKYEGKAGHWTEGPNVRLSDPSRPPHQKEVVVAQRAVDFYDDQPRYSLFRQRWRLGRKMGSFPAGRSLVVLADPIALGQNVWCKVRTQ